MREAVEAETVTKCSRIKCLHPITRPETQTLTCVFWEGGHARTHTHQGSAHVRIPSHCNLPTGVLSATILKPAFRQLPAPALGAAVLLLGQVRNGTSAPSLLAHMEELILLSHFNLHAVPPKYVLWSPSGFLWTSRLVNHLDPGLSWWLRW